LKNGKPSSSGWCVACRRVKQQTDRLAQGVKVRRRRNPVLLTQNLKECFKCDAVKPLDEFSPSARGYAGRSAWCKLCLSQWEMRDKAKHATKAAKWRTNNPLYLAQHRAHQLRRRARKHGQDTGMATTTFIKTLLAERICTWCDKETAEDQRTIDHVVSLDKGGLHDPINLVMACKSCNSSKRNKDAGEFITRSVQTISKDYLRFSLPLG
jgi:5-methylcytosine-specific restriction endonuclease McrA